MTSPTDSGARTARHGPGASAVYGVWDVVYNLGLLPDERLDAWVLQTVVHTRYAVRSGLDMAAAEALASSPHRIEGRRRRLLSPESVSIGETSPCQVPGGTFRSE